MARAATAAEVVLLECRAPGHAYKVVADATLLGLDLRESGPHGDVWLWWPQHATHYSFGPEGTLMSNATTGPGARGGGVVDDGGCAAEHVTIHPHALRSLAKKTRSLAAPQVLMTCEIAEKSDDSADGSSLRASFDVTFKPTLRRGVAQIEVPYGVHFTVVRLAGNVAHGKGIVTYLSEDEVLVSAPATRLRLIDGLRSLETGVAALDAPPKVCRYKGTGLRRLRALLRGR